MTEELNTMNSGPDEPSSGLNGRLRPRKSNILSPHATKSQRRLDGKTSQDKVKRTSTPSKTSSSKPDDLAPKSDATFLCPYCDRSFASKQSLSKHARRMHGSGSKQDGFIACLFCNNYESEAPNIVRHMAESHSQLYFACINCHSRYHSPSELAEHKIKACDPKQPYRSKLRRKMPPSSLKESQNTLNLHGKDKFGKKSDVFSQGHSHNGVVISCELKPSQEIDGADIEDKITTNLILPPSKTLGTSTVVEKNAVIVLDDIQWNKRIPPNFSFHNTDADQILSRLGVVHRSPRTGESSKKDWKNIDDSTQKFEKCFDTSFYSKVASNVQENLSKFLDGSFNFNPEPDNTIKTRKSKNSVMINTAEGFPILLASEQYSRNAFDRYMPRAIAPKHKWKWDNLESDKSPDNPHQVKRDSHTNNCIITLVSSLDIWSQLRMRRKFEEKFGCAPLEKKTEKQTIISNELKDILESRELPSTPTPAVKVTNKTRAGSAGAEFPASLGLTPATAPEAPPPAVLSGEWVRPRCYVCCACGTHSRDSRAASTHASTQHPNAEVQHYEIVGEQLLNADILKHLYVPPSQMCNRTRPLRGFRECTKCRKSVTLEDLHQHMLDCAGDTPAVRRKCRYRPFGMRRRRPRLPDNTIRKKIRKDIRRQTRPKALIRPRPIRTEVGDAETIRKMIADLPAKRHRVLINPNNTSLRPRIKQRPKLLIKGRPTEELNKRKKSNNKESEQTHPGSSMSDDRTSVKSDEDKPLKPKVKRMAAKAVRRSDTDKSKVKELEGPKRKSLQGKELGKKKGSSELDNSNRSSSIENEELALDNSQKKIDIHNVDFQAKEHVDRGNSSNRDGQRPSCSGQNGNSRNRCAPVQNIPLKHSIARLTADSEKHDKSVQFHHLFLVQQECNNVNQHVPSGQELLFENEAAVLTLDKPPLHCNSKGPLDIFSVQRNKLNKPRKGLNDCIAMLKNKLVEPASNIGSIPTGHVSVQCGDDEPLYFKIDTPLRKLVSLDRNVDIFSQPENILNNCLNQTTIPEVKKKHIVNQDKTNPCTRNVDSKNQKSFFVPGQVTVKRKSSNYGTKRESIRRKSIAKQAKLIEVTSQFDIVSQNDVLHKEIVLKKDVSHKDTLLEKDSVSQNDAVLQKDHEPQNDPVSQIDAELQKDLAPQNYVEPRKDTIPLNHIPEKHEEPQKDTESISCKSLTSWGTPIPVNASLHKGKHRMNDGNKNTSAAMSEKIVIPIETQQLVQHLHLNKLPSKQETVVKSDHITNSQASISLNVTTSEGQSNDYYENCFNPQQQTDIHLNCEYDRNVLPDNYSGADFNHLAVNICPAHASTNVESIVSIPLDLSGKKSNTNTQEITSHENAYLLKKSYESYETLDLSNKNQELNYQVLDSTIDNEVVDLSIRSSHSKMGENTDRDNVTDLSVKNVNTDIPTDLTVNKGLRIIEVSVGRKNIIETVPLLYDEDNKIAEVENRLVNEVWDESPTDLTENETLQQQRYKSSMSTSGNDNKTVLKSTITDVWGGQTKLTELKMATPCVMKSVDNVQDNWSNPQEILRKTPNNIVKHLPTTKAHLNASPTNKTRETMKSIESTCVLIDSRTGEKPSIQSQKPVYDPTLIIPQYKIRAACTVDASAHLDLSIKADSQLVHPVSPNYTTAASVTPQDVLAMTTVGKSLISTQERAFDNNTVPINVSNPNTGTKYGNTTAPIYTLANACISKIESVNAITLTNNLMSIPETTIANTTSVYTIAGTPIHDPTHSAQNLPTSPSDIQGIVDHANQFTFIEKNQEVNPGTSTKNIDYKKENSMGHDLTGTLNPLRNLEHDPETARKIALLPKELVDILGNMPVDHRNQLLNVLPQYVSTPTSTSSLQCDVTDNSESSGNIARAPCNFTVPSIVDMDDSDLKNTSQLRVTQEENKHTRTFASISSFKNKSLSSSVTHPSSSIETINLDENVKTEETLNKQQLTISKEQHEFEKTSDMITEDSFTALTTNRSPLCQKDSVKKATDDDIAPRVEILNQLTLETSPQMSLLVQPKRTKANNDQTASLRAVRIKAPSERQKSTDNQLLQRTTLTPLISNKINSKQDNEVIKSLQVNVSLNTDISLAIQQAEVSSTQHSSKNVVPECKFPSAVSPNAPELNVDETNNCTSRKIPPASGDETTKSGGIQNITSGAKSTLVTSSIVNNKANKESTDASANNCSSLGSEFSNNEQYPSNIVSKNVITQKSSSLSKSTLNVPDISKACESDLPTQNCSLEQSEPVPKKHKEQTRTSVNRIERNTCEEQEDSDDDLSLAVICKQKNHSFFKKNAPLDEAVSKKSSITTRKKVRKNRKIENVSAALVLSVKGTCDDSSLLSNTLNSNDEEIGISGEKNVSPICVNNDQPIIQDQSIKSKGNKVRRSKVANKTIGKTQIEVSNDIKYVIVPPGEVSIADNPKHNVKYTSALKDERKRAEDTRKPLHLESFNSSKKIISNKTINISKQELSQRQTNKKKKILPADIPLSEPGLENEDQKHSSVRRSSKEVEQNSIEITDTKTDSNRINLSSSQSDEKNIEINSSDTNVKEAITIHKTNTSKVPSTLYHNTLDETQNTKISLRHTRRKKSLNLSDDDESLHAEALLENRTPLTKKQLIFSKLLLDEENNVKLSEDVSVSEDKLSTLPEVIPSQPVFIKYNNIEENKTVKRKRSPNIKRKCKKKKPHIFEEEPSVFELNETSKDIPIISQIKENQDKYSEQSPDNLEADVPSATEPNKLTSADIDSSLLQYKKAIEKRKSSDSINSELSPSSLPKKTKLSITDVEKTLHSSLSKADKDNPHTRKTLSQGVDCKKESHGQSHPGLAYENKEKDNSTQKEARLNEDDFRVRTCYNMPVANRRTRSKSAVIKTAAYDPYDIDMDDMIEPSKPILQPKISSDQKQSNITKEKKDFTIVEEKNKKRLLNEVGRKKRSLSTYSKDETSDSDDSSKSDIPLKRYVEDKEKKIYELEESDPILKNDMTNDVESDFGSGNSSFEKQNNLNDNRSRRTLGICNSGDGVVTHEESVEQLRSEQFMESFGFFSERKPRKSNLLATKKISETFHIIANECDDMYFSFKGRNSKRSMQNENRKSIEGISTVKGIRQRSPTSKKTVKRGRKKKTSTVTTPSYCHICKKEFRRPDNYLRHQMTLLHVSKLSEVEMKVKTVPVNEEPNYLIAYKEHLDRIKAITDKMTKHKKKSKSAPKITPLTLEEILADVNKIVREQQLSQRGLSCDEELFLDCCELLKESHKKQEHVSDMQSLAQDTDSIMGPSQSANVGLDLLGKNYSNKCDSRNEGDVDSITAKTILESEEVRNLENDLISGLKEAANAGSLKTNIVFQHAISQEDTNRHQGFSDHFYRPGETGLCYDHEESDNCEEEPEELDISKSKKYPEFKEKMYPDIEEFDMFEDKFDKIKRKCRSQAAAAKSTPLAVEPSSSRKGRKKSEKKKGKKSLKKSQSSAVLTKGALKGFDGIKVSIPTSEINISAIVSPLETAHKRRKKGNSKKKKEIKCSESSSKYDSDHPANDRSSAVKNVDVYEFMDNEDVELFEFRPSTLMERFKSISSKDTPSTSKVVDPVVEEADNSSVSASDGDDFVYMSDDYVCSDNETENSLTSCDVSNTKIVNDSKKVILQMKRKDVVEKNAVMGKIFRNNAVRTEKKITKSKEPVKPKANLDQLFDSLLEEEPSSSMLNDESLPLKDEATYAKEYDDSSPDQPKYEALSSKYEPHSNIKNNDNLLVIKENFSALKQKNDDSVYSATDHGPLPTKISMKSLMGEHKNRKYRKRHSLSPQELKSVLPIKFDATASKKLHLQTKQSEKTSFLQDDFIKTNTSTSKNTGFNNDDVKSHQDHITKINDKIAIGCDYNYEFWDQALMDETGVARQRARRKCTVGKQNILAETWSSESEPDGGPPRPNSAESVMSGMARRKKGKKKDGHHAGRRGNNRHISFKKQDLESRVSSSNRNTTTHSSGTSSIGVVENKSTGSTDETLATESNQASTCAAFVAGCASESMSACASASTSTGGAPTPPEGAESGGGRFRTVFFWSPEGGESHEQHLRQQHGWIVGDSHKKLVTMLAHAKGRKRNNDDKRHLVE